MRNQADVDVLSNDTDRAVENRGGSTTAPPDVDPSRRGRVLCRKSAVDGLTPGDRDAMFQLFERHYDRTNRNRFDQDLNAKRWALRLFDAETQELCGFSTQTLMRFEHGGRTVRVLFSGDTIVDPAYWGETALIRCWGQMVAELIKSESSEPLYWFLISKGYKTYRFLTVFFREYFPRLDRETPSDSGLLIDALAGQMFPHHYDARRRIVAATPDKDRLRSHLAFVEPSRIADPHIRFFLEKNPNYASGDELCCLAPLEFRNFTAAGVRLLDAQNQRYVKDTHAGIG